MCYGISGAQGTHTALCQSSDKSDLSDLSDILCPQYRHCAMRSASRWECTLFSGERHAHGAGVRHLAGRARSHVLWNFRGTGHPHSPVPIVRTSPYKSVQVRIPLPAPCALRNVPLPVNSLQYRYSILFPSDVIFIEIIFNNPLAIMRKLFILSSSIFLFQKT